MSASDRKWLEEALKQYTFNDAERLKEISDELKTHMTMLDKAENLIELLDELHELVELHPRNNLNLCLSGGMPTLLKIICTNPNPTARSMAASIVSGAVSNNAEV